MPVFLCLPLPVLTAYSDCTLEEEEDHSREEAPQCCLVPGAGAGARGGSITVNGSLWAVV